MKKTLFIITSIILLFAGIACAQESTLTFTWEQTDINIVDGWFLYVSTDQATWSQDVYIEYTGQLELTTSYVLTVPANAQTTFYFYITAYNEYGESEASNIVSQVFDTRIPVSPVLTITVVVGP